MKKPTVSVEIPEYLQAAVNKLVRYYSEGWRAGYLEGFTKMGAAIIRPIGAIGGQKPQTMKIEQANVQTVESDCVHESRKIYGDCACDKEEPEPEIHPEKVADAVLEVVEKPKRKKREKPTAIVSPPLPPKPTSVKKSGRTSMFDMLRSRKD